MASQWPVDGRNTIPQCNPPSQPKNYAQKPAEPLNTQNERTPLSIQLNICAIDLGHQRTETGHPVVTMRLICAETGVQIDVPMIRSHAEAFGESLRNFAAADLTSSTRPTPCHAR